MGVMAHLNVLIVQNFLGLLGARVGLDEGFCEGRWEYGKGFEGDGSCQNFVVCEGCGMSFGICGNFRSRVSGGDCVGDGGSYGSSEVVCGGCSEVGGCYGSIDTHATSHSNPSSA